MRGLSRLGAALALLVLAGAAAHAQSSLGIGSAEVTVRPSGGVLGHLFVAINGWQNAFFAELRHALVAMKNGGAGVGGLVALSFAYGVFHAAGPGHGKAVVSAYVLANEAELKRGIVVSFASALLQAASAFVLVGTAYWFLRGTALTLTGATAALEIASYALVAGFGAWLLARKLLRLARRRNAGAGAGRLAPLAFAPAPAAAGPAMRLAFAAPGAPAGALRGPIMRPASGAIAAEVCAVRDDEDCDCGRTHMPAPALLKAGSRFTPGTALSAALAVGLRPCSGAIVVLTFALVNGLWLGGALSVLAMALGTAITVSTIAAATVLVKGFAARAGGSRFASRVAAALEIGGALLLMVLGLALLGGALAGL